MGMDADTVHAKIFHLYTIQQTEQNDPTGESDDQ